MLLPKNGQNFGQVEIKHATKELKTGETVDQYQIKAEVLPNISDTSARVLTQLFENYSQQHYIPPYCKKCTLTSIPQRVKPPEVIDNHQGITVATTIGSMYCSEELNPYKQNSNHPLNLV